METEDSPGWLPFECRREYWDTEALSLPRKVVQERHQERLGVPSRGRLPLTLCLNPRSYRTSHCHFAASLGAEHKTVLNRVHTGLQYSCPLRLNLESSMVGVYMGQTIYFCRETQGGDEVCPPIIGFMGQQMLNRVAQLKASGLCPINREADLEESSPSLRPMLQCFHQEAFHQAAVRELLCKDSKGQMANIGGKRCFCSFSTALS